MDFFNDTGVRTFLVQVIVPIMLILIGIVLLSRHRKASYGEVAQTSFVSIVALVFIGGGALLVPLGSKIATGLFG